MMILAIRIHLALIAPLHIMINDKMLHVTIIKYTVLNVL